MRMPDKDHHAPGRGLVDELERAIDAVCAAGPITQAMSDAFEHCRWVAGGGHTAHQVLRLLGVEASPWATWGEAIWKLAEIWPGLPHVSDYPPGQ
jgi:hypothetical protein